MQEERSSEQAYESAANSTRSHALGLQLTTGARGAGRGQEQQAKGQGNAVCRAQLLLCAEGAQETGRAGSVLALGPGPRASTTPIPGSTSWRVQSLSSGELLGAESPAAYTQCLIAWCQREPVGFCFPGLHAPRRRRRRPWGVFKMVCICPPAALQAVATLLFAAASLLAADPGYSGEQPFSLQCRPGAWQGSRGTSLQHGMTLEVRACGSDPISNPGPPILLLDHQLSPGPSFPGPRPSLSVNGGWETLPSPHAHALITSPSSRAQHGAGSSEMGLWCSSLVAAEVPCMLTLITQAVSAARAPGCDPAVPTACGKKTAHGHGQPMHMLTPRHHAPHALCCRVRCFSKTPCPKSTMETLWQCSSTCCGERPQARGGTFMQRTRQGWGQTAT